MMMTQPTQHNDETARLNALREYAILDTEPEQLFDNIVQTTARQLEMPISLLTFVDKDRQWYKSRVGFLLPELPRGIGFDSYVISSPGFLVINDATIDPRFQEDALVISEFNIRFYAGAPLTTPEGHTIGVLSIMDHTPRKMSPDQQRHMTTLASQIMLQLNLRRKLLAPSVQDSLQDMPSVVSARLQSSVPIRTVLPDVLMRFNRDLRFMYVSPSVQSTLGIKPETLMGRLITDDNLPKSLLDPLHSALIQVLQSRQVYEIEFVYGDSNSENALQSRFMPELSNGDVNTILTITRALAENPEKGQSLSVKKQVDNLRAEEEISGRTRLASLYMSVATAMLSDSPLHDILQNCLEALASYCEASLMRFWIRETGGGKLVLLNSAGTIAGQGHPPLFSIFEARMEIASSEVTELALGADTEWSQESGLTVQTGYPLANGKEIIGLITLLHTDPITDENHNVNSEISERLAHFIVRLRASENIQEEAAAMRQEVQDARLALQREADRTHELRTPLNSVIGITGLLMDTDLSAAQQELVEMAQTSSRALMAIVNNTLDIAKMEQGELQLDPSPFDLRLLVEEVGEVLAPKAHSKGLDLIVRCAPNMPFKLVGDAGRIRQIVTNLGDNAIKFAHQGYILIDASYIEKKGSPSTVQIEVEDTGIGIAADKIGLIFDRYQQAGHSTDLDERGTGLGLSICRQFAELMKGNIVASSKLGEGAVFQVSLPLPVADIPPIPTRENLAGVRVLIVGGAKLQQYALHELLSYYKVKASLVNTSTEMMEALQTAAMANDPYKIVLFDDKVDENDIQLLAYTLRANPRLRKTRIVLLVTVDRYAYAQQMRDQGLATYLTKPLRRMPLWEILTGLIESIRSEPPTVTDVQALVPPKSGSKKVDPWKVELQTPSPKLEIPSIPEALLLPREASLSAEADSVEAVEHQVPQVEACSTDIPRIPELTQPTPMEPPADMEEASQVNLLAETPVISSPEIAEPQFAKVEELPIPKIEEPLIAKAEVLPIPVVEAMPVSTLQEHAPLIEMDDMSLQSDTSRQTAVPAIDEAPIKPLADDLFPPAAARSLPVKVDNTPIQALPVRENAPLMIVENRQQDEDKVKQSEPLPNPLMQAEELHATDVSPEMSTFKFPAKKDLNLFALVVEDDLVNQKVVQLMLMQLGIRVKVASNGKEALDRFEKESFDLVLMDCSMPIMDGYETTTEIRRRESGKKHTPIIAVTGDTSPGARDRCISSGMDTYLTKPIQANILNVTINELLNPPVIDTKALNIKLDEILDREALFSRVSGNIEILRSLSNLCRIEFSRLIVEIREAIARGDRYEFLRATHKLRGILLSIDARAAVVAVRSLELTANQGRPVDAEAQIVPLEQALEMLQTALAMVITESGGN